MQDAEDSRPAKSKTSRPVAIRPVGKGKPPSRNDTLGALENVPTASKANEKAKPPKERSKKRTRPLNFRVPAKFRRAFKRAATAQNCKKVELLERIFTEWAARNPA